jgi:hypothetical protein
MTSAPQSTSLDRIGRLVLGLRDAYGDGRLNAASLLTHVARIMARGASRPDRADFLRAALREAFGECDVEGAALRSNIETLVEDGAMRPGVAESWAKTFGWRPFAEWADPALFNPMAQEFWTLPMTAAWIRWHKLDRSGEAYIDDETDKEATKDYWRKRDCARIVEQMRRHFHAYIAASTRWIEVEHPALPDEERHPVASDDAASHVKEQVKSGYVVGPREDRGWSDHPGEKTDTKRLLREALSSGLLKAERYSNGGFVPIPSNEWDALKVNGFHDDDGVYKVVAPHGAEHLHVRVLRKQVTSVFPFPEDESGKDTRRPISRPDTIKFIKAKIEETGRVPAADAILKELRDMKRIPDQGFIRQMIRELSGGRGPGRQPK